MLVFFKILFTALGPAQGQFHGSLGAGMIGGIFSTFIEGHDDVSAEANLGGHGALRTEKVRGAIKVRAKGDAFLGDFTQIVQAEDLEAAGIGEDGARPCHETMQASEVADGIDSRAQIEVIGIAQKNLDAEFFENILRHGFDGRDRADGHENRSLDLAVGSKQTAGPSGPRVRVKVKFDGHLF